MKKLLTLLGSLTMVGTAGATVVACGNTQTDNPEIKNPKDKLNAKIEEAEKALAENKKVAEAEKALQDAIDVAQAVYDDPDAKDEAFTEATEALNTAITAFLNADPEGEVGDIKTAALVDTINKANKALAENKKVAEAEKALQDAITTAVRALGTRESQEAVDTATEALNTAITAFKNADPEGEVGDIKTAALVDTINKANKALAENKKVAEAEKALQDAITTAVRALGTRESQEAVDTATEALNTAITAFKNADPEENENNYELFEKLKASIWNLENAVVTSVNLKNDKDPKHEIFVVAEDMLVSAKKIEIFWDESAISRTINVLDAHLQVFITADLTDFTSFEKVKEDYVTVKNALVNPPIEGLFEEIDAKISDFEQEKNDAEKPGATKMTTVRVIEVSEEIRDLVNQLIENDFDIVTELNKLSEIVDAAQKLQTEISKFWELSPKNDPVLNILEEEAREFYQSTRFYFKELSEIDKDKDKAPDKAKIQEQIDKLNKQLSDFNSRWENISGHPDHE